MSPSLAQQIRALPDDAKKAWWDALTPEVQADLERLPWWLLGRPEQQPPGGDWTVWMYLAGRGAGKTRTASEWLTAQAASQPGTRWAVIAPTYGDARDTCIEGESGLLAALNRAGAIETGAWNRSLGEIRLLNGSRIKLFSGEEPERLRGPQHHGAWVDELAAFKYPREAWDQLMFGLRLGSHPRVMISTTPKPIPLVRELLQRDDGTVAITRGSTFDNADNLAPTALQEFLARYEGTRLGRQELYGEILDDVEGALFTRALLDEHRTQAAPASPTRTVIAIDPAVTAGEDSDWTGIIAASTDGHAAWILADYTMKGSPDEWAQRAVWAAREHEADAIVAEVNNGGDMVPRMIRLVDGNIRIREVRASRGKVLRAEPVAALAEQGRLHIVGNLPDLEEQMTGWIPGMPSPDRLDALVWAVTELLLTRPAPRPVRRFKT